MLKRYEVGGLVLQYEEGHQPEGATEVKAAKPATKAKQPANKARTTSRKKAAE